MRVFLADDHPLFRIGLRIALDQETDIQLIGEASDGFSAVEKSGSTRLMFLSSMWTCLGYQAFGSFVYFAKRTLK